ncbi:MAG: hypothetical protein F4040_06285, partial [Synechococcus sp. SB0670_bin_20]|nr:hypothetical protein [Synechococcus sp. SB0670_bin_20]
MRVVPWRRWGRLLSSRSEASCSSSTVRFRLGSPLLPLLLGLPLAAGLGPTRAQAQVACTTANSDGSYTVPSDWALKPSGVAGGATFRLLFVTSTTRDATATDIATYNTFVQDRAKAGHSAVTDSCGDLFKVVGSTSAVNARANTDSESTDTDAAIYWLNGAKAADNYADFYDRSWDSAAVRDESGNSSSSVTFVWTGSYFNGTAHSSPLGTTTEARLGNIEDTNRPFSHLNLSSSKSYPFYALSPVFKVDSGSPTLTISGPASADEGDRDPMQRLFTVGLSSAVTGKVSYRVCFSGTAKLGSGSGSLAQDYRMESNGATVSNEEGCLSGLELAAGETGSGQDVGIAVLGDLFPEGDETVVATLSLEAAPEGVVLGTSVVTHTIRNDDGSKATLTLPGATTSLIEGDGPAEFVLNGSGVTSGSSYYVQFGLGGAATNRTDYRIEVRLDGQWYDVTGTAGSVLLAVGADVLPLRLRLVPLADKRVEGEESAVLTLAAGEGYTSGTPSSVTFDIGERTVAVAAAATTVTEGEAAGFTLTASPAPTGNVSVAVEVTDSGDFASGGTGARTVTVGTTGTASFSVATTDDDTDEPNGTITATVNAGTGYAPHSTEGSASVTVNDNDVAPTVFWEFRGGGIAENSGTYTREAIQANRDLGSALTVNYSLSGTATCGTDYMITGADCTTGTGAFTLPANTTAFTGVPFPVTITPDDISDNGETIIVTLTAGNGYNISGEVSTFTIYDDTGTAAFSLSGRPQVGETLSIVKDSDDPDGNGSRSFNYVWQFRATSSDDWSDLAASQRGCGDTTTCTPTHSEEYPAVGGYFRGRASYVDGNGLGTGAYTNAVGPFTLPAP